MSSESSAGIRKMASGDWEAVRAIYLEGIATGHATFETDAPTWKRWDQNHFPDPRVVAVVNDRVVGWGALSSVSSRAAYAGVAEVSVYVSALARGAGIGKALLQSLITQSQAFGIWTLQASIFPENTVSLSLHESCGFRRIGRRERIAQLNGIWRDTVLLERRSDRMGTD